jgi:hypothetical protein
MSQYTNKFTIVISAPDGALGAHLAALLEYTVNHDTSVDLQAQNPFVRTSQVFFHDLEYLYKQQDTQLSFIDFVNSWTGELPTELENRVVVTSLPVQDIVGLFPNSKIIKIATTAQDSNQLGFNYFVRESDLAKQAGKDQHLVEYYKMKSTRFFGLIEVTPDWGAILTDPMVLDQYPVQCVIRHFARDYRAAIESSTEVVPNSALIVNFSELGDVTLKNHAEANAKAVAEIYEFIGVMANKDLEVVQNIWVDFMNSFTPYHDIV